MRRGDHRHAKPFRLGLERSAGAAIAVGEVDRLVPLRARLRDRLAHRRDDALGVVVKDRGQALQIDMRQAARIERGNDLAGESAAAEHQHPAAP